MRISDWSSDVCSSDLIALLTAVTASSVFGLSKLFLIDRGWALEAIGQIGMIGGVVTVVVGCGGGAWLVRRMGIARVLLLSLGLSCAGACLWIMQASAIQIGTAHV